MVRRKVIKTKQRQTIVKRVVMEGPESDLPTSEEQAQLMLSQDAFDTTRYSDHSQAPPITQTSVSESEELLDDGTRVTRKVTTTREEQLRTERTMLEGSTPQLPPDDSTSPQLSPATQQEAPLQDSLAQDSRDVDAVVTHIRTGRALLASSAM